MEIKATVTVFKNQEYFVIHEVRTKGGWKSQVSNELYPLLHEEYELGKRVLSALDKSERRVMDDEDRDYWEVLGYKTFPAFSKKHEMVDVMKLDDFYRISYWKKDRGGYVPDRDRSEIELSLDARAQELEEGIKKVFGEIDAVTEEETCFFETMCDTRVEYRCLDYGEYKDIGDGHTDAYQIYVHAAYEKNHIGFMIDQGYDSFSSEDIKKKWEMYYGYLENYEYEECEGRSYYLQIKARSKNLEIRSYLFRDEEEVMELIFEIDLLTTPSAVQEKIKEDFIRLVESVRLTAVCE